MDKRKIDETVGKIAGAIEALRHTHEAELALATDDEKRARIRGDIEACGSLLRKLSPAEAASLGRMRQRYYQPGQRERGLDILRAGLPALKGQ